MRVIM